MPSLPSSIIRSGGPPFLKVFPCRIHPSGKQYQLWAIVEDKPASMGVFDAVADTSKLQEVSYVENAQAFAVTLEPRGGSETPTLEQMYVIGEI